MTENYYTQMVAATEDLNVPCNPHPDAPHGFHRNASHTLGRYVCTCEGWTPEEEEAWGEKLQRLAGCVA